MCSPYPSVLNGKIYNYTSTTVEFECLAGFYMTGTKILTCNGTRWGTPPTCDVIRMYDEVNVYPNWWFYVLAGILGALVLACFLCICCWCCCRPNNSVQPYGRYSVDACCACGNCCGLWCTGSRGCCRRCCRGKAADLSDTEEGHRYHNIRSPDDSAGVYFIPSTRSRETGSGFYMYQAKQLPRVHIKDQATNTDKKERKPVNDPHQTSITPTDTITATNNRLTAANGTAPRDTWNRNHRESKAPQRESYASSDHGHRESYAWSSDKGYRNSKAWKDAANSETHSDGELEDHMHPEKKPAKEVRAWLPHSKPVRFNNTSTK